MPDVEHRKAVNRGGLGADPDWSFHGARNLPAWGEREAGVRGWGDFRLKGRFLTPRSRNCPRITPCQLPSSFAGG